MASVQMEEIVEHLRSEVRRALEDAVREVTQGQQVQFDSQELFRAFRRAVRRKCSQWEYVPDHCVEKD